ncbi:Sec7-domain-containing protein, partial [Nadsonia fulvescens var. elongata DSM 6958]
NMSESSVSIDKIYVILAECASVTGEMRKNARWAQSGVASILGVSAAGQDEYDDKLAARLGLKYNSKNRTSEHPLMISFANLRTSLSTTSQSHSLKLDAIALLEPFLEVIKSQSTTAPITLTALASISKFFAYNIVTSDLTNLTVAIRELSHAITHCRFEATDQADEDSVILQILSLMDDLVCGEFSDGSKIGEFMCDESVCEILETCLSMACQLRRSDILRKVAETKMSKLTRVVVSRFYLRMTAPELGGLSVVDIKVCNSSSSTGFSSGQDGSDAVITEIGSSESADNLSTNSNTADTLASNSVPVNLVDAENSAAQFTQYALPTVREFLRVLISILAPNQSHQYTDSTRLLSLSLLTTAYEVAGIQISKHEPLLTLTTDVLSKHLLQMIRSDFNPAIIKSTLRLFSAFMGTMSEHLKIQQELLLTYLLSCLNPMAYFDQQDVNSGTSTPQKSSSDSQSNGGANASNISGLNSNIHNLHSHGNTMRRKDPVILESMVESLTLMARIPSFYAMLYSNYDCDLNRQDLCIQTLQFLCSAAGPESANWTTASVPPLCLESILFFLQNLVDRMGLVNEATETTQIRNLIELKDRKRIVVEGVAEFNKNPKKGVEMLIDSGAIESNSPADIVKFLRSSTILNKKLLGEYISKQQHIAILHLFIESFDFSNKRLDEALRDLLTTFRLPGESQMIERIVEKFSAVYCQQNGEESGNDHPDISNADAAFVLSYSVIMLNTDLHNPKIKNHMTLESYKNNLKRCNDNKDFAEDYLKDMYDTIKNHEIVMPGERDDEEGFEYFWKATETDNTSHNDYLKDEIALAPFDKYIFDHAWEYILSSLTKIFSSATEDLVFSRVIAGFDQLTMLAINYSTADILDQIFQSLASLSLIGDKAIFNPALVPLDNVEIDLGKKEGKIIVSDLSVGVGSEVGKQLATVVLFRIARFINHSNQEKVRINQGWEVIVVSLLNLYLNNLIGEPKALLKEDATAHHALVKLAHLPDIKTLAPQKVPAKDTPSLFSTLSSFLTSSSSSSVNSRTEVANGIRYADQIPTDEEIEATLCAIDCVNNCAINEVLDGWYGLSGKQLEMLVDRIILLARDLVSQQQQQLQSLIKDKNMVQVNSKNTDGLNLSDNTAAIFFIMELIITLAIKDAGEIKVKNQVIEFLKTIISYETEDGAAILSYLARTLKQQREQESLDNQTNELLKTSLVISLASLADEDAPMCHAVLQSSFYWQILMELVLTPSVSSKVFQFVEGIILGTPKELNENNFQDVILVLEAIAKSNEVVINGDNGSNLHRSSVDGEVLEKCVKAVHGINAIYTLLSPSVVTFDAIWIPYSQTLTTLILSSKSLVRTQSLLYLQQSLLSSQLQNIVGFQWRTVFERVLFPCVENMLKPEIWQTGGKGMDGIRTKVAEILCKVFLQYIINGVNYSDVMSLWKTVLVTLDRLVTSGQTVGKENVIESLKNLLLIMNSSAFLVEPKAIKGNSDADSDDNSELKSDMWNSTWLIIDGFVPGLREELFPDSQSPHRVSG